MGSGTPGRGRTELALATGRCDCMTWGQSLTLAGPSFPHLFKRELVVLASQRLPHCSSAIRSTAGRRAIAEVVSDTSPDAWEKTRCATGRERSKLPSKYYLLMGGVQPQAPLLCLGEVGVYLTMSQSARWELLGREKQGRERGVQ